VNGIFISSSNEMGDVRSGGVTSAIGPVATVVLGGIMAIGVAVGGSILFSKLRKLNKVTDAAGSDYA